MPQPPQRGVDRGEDVLAGQTAAVRARASSGSTPWSRRTSSSRRSSFGSSRPVTTSLTPSEYMSAVSKNVMPPSTARRTIGSAAASSSIHGPPRRRRRSSSSRGRSARRAGRSPPSRTLLHRVDLRPRRRLAVQRDAEHDQRDAGHLDRVGICARTTTPITAAVAGSNATISEYVARGQRAIASWSNTYGTPTRRRRRRCPRRARPGSATPEPRRAADRRDDTQRDEHRRREPVDRRQSRRRATRCASTM